MKTLFDSSSLKISELVTKTYSTSFSLACKFLSPKIRPAIYAIYSFVRYADEIVDSFQGYEQEQLLNDYESSYYKAHKQKISLNPVVNVFQEVVHRYGISDDMIQAFFNSMRMDLHKKEYSTHQEYKDYIYGSADVVGLMCLRVFVDGNNIKYEKLKSSSMKLSSAFQKVNFLRDLKDDSQRLSRSYFPNISFQNLTSDSKMEIIKDIENDFAEAYDGIVKLPLDARLGVYTSYRYYYHLLCKLKQTEVSKIQNTRIRVTNMYKFFLLGKSYIRCQLNLL